MAMRTRSKRRSEMEASISHEQELIDTELALEAAEKNRSRLSKKRRLESWERNHPPFELLPNELLPNILVFLDSAKDVYSLSRCSKSLRDSISPEIVVRSAVFQGGKAK